MPHTNTVSVQSLRDQRARLLDEIDDIVNTAREASRSTFNDDERQRHDTAVAELEVLERLISQASGTGSGYGTVNVNRGRTAPAHAERSLDELLWATDDTVRAGQFSERGVFMPSNTGATAPVEQVVVRAKDESTTVHAPRIGELAQDHRQAVRSFQSTVADMAVFGMLVDKHASTSADGFEVARSHPLFRDRWHHVLRAMDVDTTGEGGNWVPTGIGASLHEKVRAAGKIAPLFNRIDLPTNPWKWPIEGADSSVYRVAEPTSDTATKVGASTPGTVAATFDAEIFGGRTLVSRSMDADSAVAMTPFITGKLARAFVDAEEKAILDGDSDGTHQDSDVQAIGATDPRTAWDGLRKKALAQTSADAGGALSGTILRTLRALMGKWGINPADLAIIVGISSYYDLLSDTDLLTVEKLGPQATILNGQLGAILGAPVIVSEHVREDLNASGVHDGITETKTYAMIVNRSEWAMGQRMALDIEVDDSIYRESFQRAVVAFMREDFAHIGDAAANDDTAISYNATP